MHQPLSSISALFVVGREPFDRELARQLMDELATIFVDVEAIIVANGVTTETAIRLKEAAELLPDCTVLFLTDQVHNDIAILLGIDHAISDYVLISTPLKSQIELLPQLIRALTDGNDVVIADVNDDASPGRSGASALLFALFRVFHKLATGRPYEVLPPAYRAYSRASALYITTRRDAEVLIRARSLGEGFPAATIPTTPAIRPPARNLPFRMSVAKAVRLLLTGSSVPLRLASYLGFGGGILSIIYAIYVVLVYMLKADVAPGWTTLSLQLSGMLFLFSWQFLFISEYLVQILSTSPAVSRRQLVARELRGAVSSRSNRLNVLEADGRFHLGAPKQVAEN